MGGADEPDRPGTRGSDRLTHHDLCFGCGLANLFGLQLEAETDGEGVTGRFFVKQDQQGPPGQAHGGVVGAALDEVMALAVHARGVGAVTARYEVELKAPAAVGTFVRLAARVERREANSVWVSAEARTDDGERELASARALFVEHEGAR